MALRHPLTALALLTTLLATAVATPDAHAAGPEVRGAATHPLWSSNDLHDSARELDLLADAHANAVRIDLGWSTLQADGRNSWSSWYVAKADAFFAQAHARGIKVLVTFWTTPCWASSAPASIKQDCAGAWWDRGVDRYPPTDPADYARAAAWVVDRWGEDIAALEVWNEPNYDAFFNTSNDTADYAALLKATYPVVKQADPNATVLGPAMLMSDAAWLGELYAAGIKGSFDAVSIHPFNYGFAPGDQTNRYGPKYSYALGVPWVHDSMAAHGDGDKPIWFTEFGWSSCAPTGTSSWCISEETQARYIADAWRMTRDWPYVEGAFIYSLRNKGTDPGGRESQMGMVHADFRPKPSYAAFGDVLDELSRPDPPPPSPGPEPDPQPAPDANAGQPPLLAATPTAPSPAEPPAPPPVVPPRDASAPELGRVAVRPQRLRSARAVRKALLVWRLSEPARLELVLQRLVRGRLRSSGKSLQLDAVPAGSGRARLLPRGRSLRPGRYAMRVVATDAAGNRSSPAVARFSVGS